LQIEKSLPAPPTVGTGAGRKELQILQIQSEISNLRFEILSMPPRTLFPFPSRGNLK
jgi:hypothetical protein